MRKRMKTKARVVAAFMAATLSVGGVASFAADITTPVKVTDSNPVTVDGNIDVKNQEYAAHINNDNGSTTFTVKGDVNLDNSEYIGRNNALEAYAGGGDSTTTINGNVNISVSGEGTGSRKINGVILDSKIYDQSYVTSILVDKYIVVDSSVNGDDVEIVGLNAYSLNSGNETDAVINGGISVSSIGDVKSVYGVYQSYNNASIEVKEGIAVQSTGTDEWVTGIMSQTNAGDTDLYVQYSIGEGVYVLGDKYVEGVVFETSDEGKINLDSEFIGDIIAIQTGEKGYAKALRVCDSCGTVSTSVYGNVIALAENGDATGLVIDLVVGEYVYTDKGAADIYITGDVFGDKAGIHVNGCVNPYDVIVEGTIAGGEYGVVLNKDLKDILVETDGNGNDDDDQNPVTITTWKIDLNERGNAVEWDVERGLDGTPVDLNEKTTPADDFELQNVNYIIKVEQPGDKEGVDEAIKNVKLSVTKEDGTALDKKDDYEIAHVGDKLILKAENIPEGYEISAAYYGDDVVDLEVDEDGNYYLIVPKGGGVDIYADITKEIYNVTFQNDDGTVLEEQEVEYGETPKYSKEEPEKKATVAYEYTFSGWTPEITAVTKDAVYTATYKEELRSYDLTFDLGGGTLDGKTGTITISCKYGSTINLPKAPTKDGNVFKCWKGSEYEAGAEYKVEGAHAFTAVWEAVEEEKKENEEPVKEPEKKNDGDNKSDGDEAKVEPNTEATTVATDTAPKTSDDSAPELMMVLLAMSLFGMGTMYFLGRKKNNK